MDGGKKLPKSHSDYGALELRSESLTLGEITSPLAPPAPRAGDLTRTPCGSDIEVGPNTDVLLLLDLLAAGLVDRDLRKQQE